MTAHIVHWKEIVGDEFMPKFTEISKGLFFADQQGPLEWKGVAKKAGEDDWQKFGEAHWKLRKCGYEVKDDTGVNYGWFRAYLEHDGTMKMKTTAPPGREYISLSQYLSWKQDHEQGVIEDRYYAEVDKAKRIVMNPDYFPHEDDIEEPDL